MMDSVLAAQNEIPVSRGCEALGLSRATLYRPERPTRIPPTRTPRRVTRKLSEPERAKVIETLHSEEFVDQPPGEIVATLLSRGVYLASVRTFYRILEALDEVRERRAQRRHPPAVKPQLTATAPQQVWTWDITKVAGPVAGVFFCVYVLIDLFSRYVVGWLVSEREDGKQAARWLKQTIERWQVDPSTLVVHNDRGAPMTSVAFVQLCALLGVKQSYSRPRVSDDNAFSEAQFKTMKYQPDFPERFGSIVHTRSWMQEFFDWHNDGHHHAGLAMFTPADVFFDRVESVASTRQRALDVAYAAHPERFVHGPPRVARPPAEVSINPVPPCEPATPPSHPEIAETSPKASLRPVDQAPRTPTRGAKRKGSGGPPRGATGSLATEASMGCRDLARSEHGGTLHGSMGPPPLTPARTQEAPH
jgi:putative transposase